MAVPLKEYFSAANAAVILDALSSLVDVPRSAKKKVLYNHSIFVESELRERSGRFAQQLSAFLPGDPRRSADIQMNLATTLKDRFQRNEALVLMCLPDLLGVSLRDYPHEALRAMPVVTTAFSCEFVIREFLTRYPEVFWPELIRWARHPDAAVRRLASEGSRPILPWGKSVPGLRENPEKTLPVLKLLRDDPDQIVRRSVANHLGDIAKSHPGMVAGWMREWLAEREDRMPLVRHALRDRLRKDDRDALALFDIQRPMGIVVLKFGLDSDPVYTGQKYRVIAGIRNSARKSQPLHLNFRLYRKTKAGRSGQRTMRLGNCELAAGDTGEFSKPLAFTPMTTRKSPPGDYHLALVINGQEVAGYDFRLLSGAE